MKKSLLNKNMLPLNLQLFAENENDKGADDTNNDEDNNEQDEDEFTPPASQSELDSLTNKAVQKALKNAEAKQQTAIDEAVANALKKEKDYSQLSDDDRKEKELQDRLDALNEREAEADYKELLSQVKSDLADKQLPTKFADMLSVKGDKDKTLDNVKNFETEYKAAIAEGIKVSLRQKDRSSGGSGANQEKNYGEEVAKSAGATATGKLFE